MCSSDGNRTREGDRTREDAETKAFDACSTELVWNSSTRARSVLSGSRLRGSPRGTGRERHPKIHASKPGERLSREGSTLVQVDDATSHLMIPSRSGRGAIRCERKETRTRAAGVSAVREVGAALLSHKPQREGYPRCHVPNRRERGARDRPASTRDRVVTTRSSSSPRAPRVYGTPSRRLFARPSPRLSRPRRFVRFSRSVVLAVDA